MGKLIGDLSLPGAQILVEQDGLNARERYRDGGAQAM